MQRLQAVHSSSFTKTSYRIPIKIEEVLQRHSLDILAPRLT